MITRRPKQIDTLEDMIESLRILEAGSDNNTDTVRITIESFKSVMNGNAKENGENLMEHQF